MKMVRTAFVIATLLVLTRGMLTAEDLLFGTAPLPKGDAKIHEVHLRSGAWNVLVSSQNVTRLIQIKGLGPEKGIEANLVCSQASKPIPNQEWVLAMGECQLKFNPNRELGVQPVHLTVLAAELDSSKIFSNEDHEYAGPDPAEVTIALGGGSSSVPNADSSVETKETLTTDWLKAHVTIISIILVAAIMLTLFVLNRNSWLTKLDKVQEDHVNRPETPIAPQPIGRSVPPVAKTPAQENFRSQATIRPYEPTPQENVIEKTLVRHRELIFDLFSKQQDIERRIHEIADEQLSLLNQSSREAENRQSEIHNAVTVRLSELENRVTAVQEKLSEHLVGQSSKLLDLFKDLPAVADFTIASQSISRTDLAKMEENLVSAAKSAALSNEKLEQLQDGSSALLDAIQEFARVADNANRERTKKRYARIFETARVVNEELFSLGRLAATQKHGFFVQMSLLERNDLAQDLAAALARETMKLADPESYYLKRFEALRTQACVAGIDLADLDIDAERRNSDLQQALTKLIQALGMTPIDPSQNDKLQAADHQVVQFVRRVPGAQPGTIAHTMVRGLQRMGEVVRKASVLLYE
jgi:hypothetical protein